MKKVYERAEARLMSFASADIVAVSSLGDYEGGTLPTGVISMEPW